MGGSFRKSIFPALLALAGSAFFLLLCAIFPGLSDVWLRLFIRPWGRMLTSLSARVSFPLIELLAVVLAAFFCLDLLRGLSQGAATRRFRALGWLGRRTLSAVAAFFCLSAALWTPAYWGAPLKTQPASADQLDALCIFLIDRLNQADLRFSDFEASLRIACAAVSDYVGAPIPENAVKIARYPEWMDALDISGLYAPWTGEALVHPGLTPAARIFTAAHELIHAQGIADEGHANVLAWFACSKAGGEAASSADLYALRQAMTRLRTHSEERWQARTLQMDGTLLESFESVGGLEPAEHDRLSTGSPLINYSALADWLAHALTVD